MTVLCDFLDANTGQGSPTYRALEAAMGLKRWRIRHMIRALAALGYVDVEQRTGNGLYYRLKGGPLRMDLGGGGVQHDHTPPGTARPHPPGTARPHPMKYDEMTTTTTLCEKYGMGAAEAAAIANSMSEEWLAEWVAYVDARGDRIPNPTGYLLAVARKRERCPTKRRRPSADQLALAAPSELEAAHAAAEIPPETPEQAARRELDTRAAIDRARAQLTLARAN